QMAAHAVGANHHDGANRIARLLVDFGLTDLRAGFGGLLLYLALDMLLDQRPVAVESRDELAIRDDRPARLLPGRTLRTTDDVGRFVLERIEKGPPFGIYRIRVLLVLGLEFLDITGIAAVEEGGERELVVCLILSSHRLSERWLRPL